PGPYSYQWRFEGKPIYGATSPTLVLNSVQPSQQGNYSVVVMNLANSTTSSSTPIRYQWRFNGSDVLGATNQSMTISNVTLANEGSYAVRVTDAVSTQVSSNANLVVLINPLFATQPQSQTVAAGSTLAISSSVVGNP